VFFRVLWGSGVQKRKENIHMIQKLTYTVTSDWHPFRYWQVQAESEIEARMILAGELGLEVQELSATLAGRAK
jgi:hypothetical protein